MNLLGLGSQPPSSKWPSSSDRQHGDITPGQVGPCLYFMTFYIRSAPHRGAWRDRSSRWGRWRWRDDPKYTTTAFGQRRRENLERRRCSVVWCGVSVEASFTMIFPSELSHAKLNWLLTLIHLGCKGLEPPQIQCTTILFFLSVQCHPAPLCYILMVFCSFSVQPATHYVNLNLSTDTAWYISFFVFCFIELILNWMLSNQIASLNWVCF